MMRRGLLLATPLLIFLAQMASAQNVRQDKVIEYGLSVSFPARAEVCEISSGTHLHGLATPLSGTCDHTMRTIKVLANYNAAFLRSPAEATYCPKDEGGSLERGAALQLSIPGHSSATCVEEKPNGEILIGVATQAWRWPDAETSGDADMRETAWINYNAYLSTTRATFDRDLARFRTILQTVQISPPE